jgi:uncharacterized protein (TIGR03086 family)
MSDIVELHRKAVEWFGANVAATDEDQWGLQTPCEDWDVRTLVNHLVSEDLWTAPLMEGKTIAEVGTVFDGDVLGEDPKGAWSSASAEALASTVPDGAMERIVHLSFGDLPASQYAYQLFADHLIHGWDLARAIGAEEAMDPELVEACATWFASMEELYRQGGAIADHVQVPDDADAQTKLLAAFGRRA